MVARKMLGRAARARQAPRRRRRASARRLRRGGSARRRRDSFAGKAKGGGAAGKTSAVVSARSGWALTPVSGVCRCGDVARELGRRLGDARAGNRRARNAAATPPAPPAPGRAAQRLLAQRCGQRLEHAGAGGRIGDEAEMGFLQQDELRVAREPPRERVGQAEGLRERQHADAVGAAEAGRERRHRAAHHIHIGVARAHRPAKRSRHG